MSYANPDNEIDKLKNKIINIILLFGSILGLITFFVSLFNLKVTGFNISYITDSIVVSIYCVVAIFRNRIGLKPKSFIIIIGLLILILTDIVKWGIFSDNKILLVVIPFFAFLAYDLKRAIYIYILCLLTIIVIGYLQFIQYFKFHVDFTKRVLQLEPWIINILLLTAVSFIIIIIVQQFYLKFFKLINDLKKKNNDLTESEQNYREIFNASTDAIFIHDMKGKILDVNDSMLKMYGYERNDIEKLDITLNGEKSNKSFFSSYCNGLFVAVSPGNLVFWISVFGAVLSNSYDTTQPTKFLIVGAGILTGILVHDVGLLAIVAITRKVMNQTMIKWVSIIAGFILIGFAGYFLYEFILAIKGTKIS